MATGEGSIVAVRCGIMQLDVVAHWQIRTMQMQNLRFYETDGGRDVIIDSLKRTLQLLGSRGGARGGERRGDDMTGAATMWRRYFG